MKQFSIPCSSCGAPVSVSDALASEARAELEKKTAEAVAKAEKRAKEQAEASLQLIIADLRNQIAEGAKAKAKAEARELELLKEKRLVEEREKAVELEIQRGVAAAKASVEKEVRDTLQHELNMREQEHKLQLQTMSKKLEEVQRKAEQGSQQRQGEALEVTLEEALKSQFPIDAIEPVAKGARGADIVQSVVLPTGAVAGTLLWEAKRTKDWTDKWIEKIKEHQRAIGADAAIIVTEAMPKGVTGDYVLKDGVWVVSFRTYRLIAEALRLKTIEIAMARQAAEGKGGKMELLYDYLVGARFKQAVEAMVESFVELRSDLQRERTAMQKIWAARERQIDRFSLNVVTLYGDVQGIVGRSLPSIPALELEVGEPASAETVEAE